MQNNIHVFNQYYFDLLKKIKDIARVKKTNHSGAKKIIDVLKENYSEYDKSSTSYFEWFLVNAKVSCDQWATVNTIENTKEWMKNSEVLECYIFKGIQIKTVVSIVKTQKYFLHYFALLYIFAFNALTNDDVTIAVNILKI